MLVRGRLDLDIRGKNISRRGWGGSQHLVGWKLERGGANLLVTGRLDCRRTSNPFSFPWWNLRELEQWGNSILLVLLDLIILGVDSLERLVLLLLVPGQSGRGGETDINGRVRRPK